MSNEDETKKVPPFPEIGERLALALSKLDLNARRFAIEAKLSPQVVSNLLAGESEPSGKTLRLILERFKNFNTNWWLTGIGEPFPDGVYKEKAKPFFPGGEVTKFGATKMPEGALEQMLGKKLKEDDGGLEPEAPVTIKTRQEFIQNLLNEIEMHKRFEREQYALFTDQQNTIREQQNTIRFLQDQHLVLQNQVLELQQAGKLAGSQYIAPGTYYDAPTEEAPRTVINGLRRYDEPTPTGKLRQLVPMMEEELVEAVEEAA